MGEDFDRLLGAIEELREVLPIEREYERTTGGRWVIASVEVWVEMVVVRLTELGPRVPPSPFPSPPNLRDDRGNHYAFAGGGGSGNDHLRVVTFVFRPGLHPDATRLWFAGDQEQSVEIRLPPRRA
jgi:hypothetical protein